MYSPFLYEKERDNTWLQVSVCPMELKPGERCPNPEEKCPYAHPNKSVRILPNGKVVSCHDFVFSHSRSGRKGCRRPYCKYFHPPTHLRLMVINAGSNNLRLRSEIMTKQKLLQLQTQAVSAPLSVPVWPQPLNNALPMNLNSNSLHSLSQHLQTSFHNQLGNGKDTLLKLY